MDAITTAFANFDKWETYGVAYNAIKTGAATLADVQTIASDVAGIAPAVIKMRMEDCDKMTPQSPGFWPPYKTFRFEG